MLAVTYANCSGATKRDGGAFTSDDFMGKPNGKALDTFGNVQTNEQKIAILQAFTETYKAKHGRIERGERIG